MIRTYLLGCWGTLRAVKKLTVSEWVLMSQSVPASSAPSPQDPPAFPLSSLYPFLSSWRTPQGSLAAWSLSSQTEGHQAKTKCERWGRPSQRGGKGHALGMAHALGLCQERWVSGWVGGSSSCPLIELRPLLRPPDVCNQAGSPGPARLLICNTIFPPASPGVLCSRHFPAPLPGCPACLRFGSSPCNMALPLKAVFFSG